MTFIVASSVMQSLVASLARSASSMSTVFIQGERGTGKRTIARALHEASSRREKPFIVVQCATIPEALVQTEIFGYTNDAFGGASDPQLGGVAVADGGTLLLDEVADLSPEAQRKVVRLLEARSYTPYGGTTLRANVRIVATSQRDLEAEVARGSFRRDLFGRLAMTRIRVPPLRERREDIQPLAEDFLATCAEHLRRPYVRGFAPGVLPLIEKDDWPGNICELENAIQRAVVLASSPLIERDTLPARILAGRCERATLRPSIDTDRPSLTEKVLDRCNVEALEERLSSRHDDRSARERARAASLAELLRRRRAA